MKYGPWIFLLVFILGLEGSAPVSALKRGLSSLPSPTIIAHRGASGLAPEETQASYELAREVGADYLEMDIQRTADGEFVAFHDESLVRTTNIKDKYPGLEEWQYQLRHYTLAQLKELDAGSWFNDAHSGKARGAYKGLKILTLREISKIARTGTHRPGLYVEFKNPELYPGYEEQIIDLLKNEGWIGDPGADEAAFPRIIFQSFSAESLEKAVRLAPGVPTVYLIERDDKGEWENAIETASKSGFSGIGPSGALFGKSVFAIFGALFNFPDWIKRAHKNQLIVHPWTLNQGFVQKFFVSMGADGFFTDRCDIAITTFGRAESVDTDAILQTLGYPK